MGYRHLPTRRAAVKRELKIDTTTSKKKAAYAIRSRREFQLRMGLTRGSGRRVRRQTNHACVCRVPAYSPWVGVFYSAGDPTSGHAQLVWQEEL